MADKKKFYGVNAIIPVRLQWANRLFVKDTGGTYSNDKYGATLLIDKSDTATVAQVRKVIAEAAVEGIKAGLLDKDETLRIINAINRGESGDPDFFYPLQDGDGTGENLKGETYVRSERQPELKGQWFMNATSQRQPRLYDTHARLYDEQHMSEARRDIYSGAYVRVNLFFNVFGPNKNVRKGGISLWVNAVQKLHDGERFGGPANDGFTPVDDEDFTTPTNGESNDTSSDASMFAAMGI